MIRKTIAFEAKYVDQIRSGRKRSTIRRSTTLQPGDVVNLIAGPRSNRYTFAVATVTRLRRGKVDSLTRSEGMRQSIDKRYGRGAALVQIHFNVTEATR